MKNLADEFVEIVEVHDDLMGNDETFCVVIHSEQETTVIWKGKSKDRADHLRLVIINAMIRYSAALTKRIMAEN